MLPVELFCPSRAILQATFLSEPGARGLDIQKVPVAGMKLDLPVDIGGRFLYRTGLKCRAASIK